MSFYPLLLWLALPQIIFNLIIIINFLENSLLFL